MANEKRLIDANAIYDAVERRYKVSSGTEHRCERDLLDLICAADTVDAVEVVRCKDCKHFNMRRMECENECISTDNEGGADYSINFKVDDFCSYGERKNVGESGQNTQKNVGRREGECQTR